MMPISVYYPRMSVFHTARHLLPIKTKALKRLKTFYNIRQTGKRLSVLHGGLDIVLHAFMLFYQLHVFLRLVKKLFYQCIVFK